MVFRKVKSIFKTQLFPRLTKREMSNFSIHLIIQTKHNSDTINQSTNQKKKTPKLPDRVSKNDNKYKLKSLADRYQTLNKIEKKNLI